MLSPSSKKQALSASWCRFDCAEASGNRTLWNGVFLTPLRLDELDEIVAEAPVDPCAPTSRRPDAKSVGIQLNFQSICVTHGVMHAMKNIESARR
jgi:hypothetical protein